MGKKKKRDELETLINGDADSSKREKKKKKDKDKTRETARDEEPVLDLVNGNSGKKPKREKNKKKRGRDSEREEGGEILKEIPTVSIAIAGSIIDNAQSLELATRLAGQIARAATIFRVDEVVVFDNKSSSIDESRATTATECTSHNESGAAFLVQILEYLETPQYLRKTLIQKHDSLRLVGLLPPLDAPHHLRKHEWGPYREGVTLKEKAPSSGGTLVDVGLNKNIMINEALDPGIRVTVSMGTNRNLNENFPREIVSPSKPKEEGGLYWGYKVRYASNISAVFKDSPYKGGYDHVIGTSEHGQFVKPSELSLPSFRHLLIAFGGLAGLEEGIEEDANLKGKKPKEVFHSYFNTCPNQGSRTIRSEEAIFISLQYFQEPINKVLQKT